jgi:hypothetical protein
MPLSIDAISLLATSDVCDLRLDFDDDLPVKADSSSSSSLPPAWKEEEEEEEGEGRLRVLLR